MDRKELEAVLPHRGRMLLLDEAETVDNVAHARYTVRGDEFFLDGHFPGNPIVPGVIQCEMLAQSVCVLLQGVLKPGQTPLYTGLKNVRFKSTVRPGDTIELESTITRIKLPFYFAEGKGTVNGNVCVTAEFSFAIID